MKWNVKWKPYLIAGTVALGGIGVGAGISLGVVLPKANAAKLALEQLIPSGGPANSLKDKDSINYLAIGDSATAGYNGLIGQIAETQGNSYRSYSDFLAGSLKNNNRLGEYHNLAISGGRLADISKDLFEIPTSKSLLAEADLITITIGANDILSVLNMLQMTNFYNFANISAMLGKAGLDAKNVAAGEQDASIMAKYPFLADFSSFDPSSIPSWDVVKDLKKEDIKRQTYDNYYGTANQLVAGTPYDHEYDSDYITSDEIFGNDTDFMVTKGDSIERFDQTTSQIMQLLSGNPEPFLNVAKGWNEDIFTVIRGQIALLTKQLHEMAGDAQIIFLGYAFPFEQFPDSFVNTPKPALDNRSLAEAYDYLLSEIEAGTQTTTGEPNRYVKFVNANELNAVSEANKAGKDLDYTVDVFGEDKNLATFDDNQWSNKVMPNITDIHPSVYGYDKIAEGLFKEYIGPDMGLSTTKINSSLQSSTPFDMTAITAEQQGNYVDPWSDWDQQANWARLDEDPRLFKTTVGTIKWEMDKAFYGMLQAPTDLATNLEGTTFSVSDILESSLKDIQTLIDKEITTENPLKTEDILTADDIASSLKDKFDYNGIKVGNLLANKVKDKAYEAPTGSEWLDPVLDGFYNISEKLIKLSTDIYHLKDNINKNEDKWNESELFAYSENGQVSIFSTFQTMLLEFQKMQTYIATLNDDSSTPTES